MNRQSLSLVSWIAPQILIAVTVFFAAGNLAQHNGSQNLNRQAEIRIGYAMDPDLRAQQISVVVRGSDAFLIGTVANSVERDLAERIARNVSGIRRVDNRLEIAAGNRRQPERFRQPAVAAAIA